MKKKYALLVAFIAFQLQAQAVYNANQYAAVGDVFYNTSTTDLTLDYEATGTSFNWDFATLTGTSQTQLQFRNPTATGFLWLFIYNSNNTNLSSTTNETPTLNIPGQVVGVTDANNYYKKSTTDLRQTGSAYKVDYNGTQIPITNQYTDSDIVYRFPIQYGNTDTDISAYSIDIPTLIHQENTLERTNEVDGWGSLTTPYGSFSNVLRMKTMLVSNDSIALLGTGLPRTITNTRELKWFDTSKKQPVLVVTQSNATGSWVTTNVTYLDIQRDFATTAFFTHAPINPAAGEEVFFQNLSANATIFSWNFGDPTSGTANTSSEEYPTHTFAADGEYEVQLTASNGTYTDTYIFTIIIGNLAVNQNSIENNAVVYPNPFTTHFKLNIKPDDASYLLTNLNGQQIFAGKNIEAQDFSTLTAGIYFLTVWNNREIKKHKIIKK